MSASRLVTRTLDLILASIGVLLTLPLIAFFAFLIFLGDRRSPFYISNRIGRDGKPFRLYKLRSMHIGADICEIDSTASSDSRITKVGSLVRRTKIDELPQLWNVLLGDMSLVGPRPNVPRETEIYTPEENRLLSVLPGVTDLASIVFSDEGEILDGHADANLAYNQLVRPYKSRLALVYVNNRTASLYLRLIGLTVLSFFSRRSALRGVHSTLADLNVDVGLQRIALRETPLVPCPPPGADSVVTSRAARP